MNPFTQQQEIAFARQQLFEQPKELWANTYFDTLKKPWLDLQEATLFVIEMEALEDKELHNAIYPDQALLGTGETPAPDTFDQRIAA